MSGTWTPWLSPATSSTTTRWAKTPSTSARCPRGVRSEPGSSAARQSRRRHHPDCVLRRLRAGPHVPALLDDTPFVLPHARFPSLPASASARARRPLARAPGANHGRPHPRSDRPRRAHRFHRRARIEERHRLARSPRQRLRLPRLGRLARHALLRPARLVLEAPPSRRAVSRRSAPALPSSWRSTGRSESPPSRGDRRRSNTLAEQKRFDLAEDENIGEVERFFGGIPEPSMTLTSLALAGHVSLGARAPWGKPRASAEFAHAPPSGRRASCATDRAKRISARWPSMVSSDGRWSRFAPREGRRRGRSACSIASSSRERR